MIPVLTMVALGGACWLLRVLFIAVVPASRLPVPLVDALRHLAPAVMAALVAVTVRDTTQGDNPVVATYVVLAVIAVGLVAWRTRNMSLAVGLSLAAALVLDLALT